MDNFKIPVEVDPNEDTEWNDILRSHGIIPEKPPSPTAELEAALEEAIQAQHENRLQSKDLDELNELEDDEDEEFLNFYKQQRMKQIQELSSKKKYGQIYPINKQEYEKEITLCSEDCFVLLHMTCSSQIQSRVLTNIFENLSKKFPEIKFCEIMANRCVENYPDTNCPTLIIYHKTHVVKQFITLTQLGGNDCKIADIENVLIDSKAVDINDKRLTINQLDEDLQQERKLRFVKKSIRDDKNNDNNDDDDDFFD